MNKPLEKISSDQQVSTVRRVTLVGLVANVILSAAKLAAGWFGRSNAVFADGIHSLSDCVTDVAVLVGVRFWTKPPDACHPYGHRRIETLITVFVGLVLVVAALGLAIDAITSIADKSTEPPGIIGLFAALASIVVKEILFRWTKKSGEKVNSSALVANAWHHRTDALSSLPVALAVAATLIDPSLHYFDKIGAIVVSAFILWAAWKIVTPGLSQLVDRAASPKDVDEILAIAKNVDGVCDAHAVRTRMSGLGTHVDMHIVVDEFLTVRKGHDISTAVQLELKQNGPGLVDVVVHVEPDK